MGQEGGTRRKEGRGGRRDKKVGGKMRKEGCGRRKDGEEGRTGRKEGREEEGMRRKEGQRE